MKLETRLDAGGRAGRWRQNVGDGAGSWKRSRKLERGAGSGRGKSSWRSQTNLKSGKNIFNPIYIALIFYY